MTMKGNEMIGNGQTGSAEMTEEGRRRSTEGDIGRETSQARTAEAAMTAARANEGTTRSICTERDKITARRCRTQRDDGPGQCHRRWGHQDHDDLGHEVAVFSERMRTTVYITY